MREIKFRAWDKKYNMMIQAESFQRDQMWISGIGEVFEIGEWSDYGGGGKTEDDCSDQYILMQYTGLKDKNGKEIYEGDIIHDRKYDAGLGKVYWSQEYGGWSVHFFTQYTEQLHEWLVDYNEGAEIIGNIYENSELLKGDGNDYERRTGGAKP